MGKKTISIRADLKTLRVWLDGRLLSIKESRKIYDHSMEFNWGYGGSGPAQLALAILLNLTKDPGKAVRQHQEFKRKYIARLPRHSFDKEFEVEYF